MEPQGSAFVTAQAEGKRRTQFARRSYMPSWMAGSSWLESVEVPEEHMMELFLEERDGSRRSTSASQPSFIVRAPGQNTNPLLAETARHTVSSWTGDNRNIDTESAQESLMSLLADVVKAVTQRTPWDPVECGTEVRKGMLAVLIKKFLDQSLNPGVVGLFAKDVLRRVSDAGVAQELQYLYEAFTSDKTWNGKDSYRREENFIRRPDYEAFQKHCLEEVRRRLNMLDTELSGKEINERHSKRVWNDIHGAQRGECFGGCITLSLMRVQLRDTEEEKCTKNGSRTMKGLPQHLKAIWSLQQKSWRVASEVVPGKSALKDGIYTWQSDSRVTLMVPRGASEHFKDYIILLELFVPQLSCFCTAPKEKIVASATITVDDALYVSVAQPNSPLRRSDTCPFPEASYGKGSVRNEPITTPNVGIKGYHFSSVLLSPATTATKNVHPYTIESAKTLCSMYCLNREHNTRPPAINLEGEGGQTRPNMDVVATTQDAWSTDHHNSFLRLVDILGDIDDMGGAIIKAYCRRYLIHGELETVAVLISVCTRCNLADETSWERCTCALASLLNLRGTAMTHVTKRLVKEALEATQSCIFDIILSLEDVRSTSLTSFLPLNPRELEKVLEEMKKLLLLFDQNMNVNDAILQEAQREVRPLMEALERLDGRVLREHRREVVRETITDLSLPELERQKDGARLRGKSHYLLELMTQVTERSKRAFSFAKMSGSPSIMAIAICRLKSLTEAICVPLRNVVTRILACLVRTPEPDPLGETLGLLVSTYGSVMSLVDILDNEPGTASICRDLAGCFTDFISFWFPLCEGHISTWMTSIVTSETLKPLVPNAVHFNHSPGLLQDLLQALLAVFVRMLAWTDPCQHEMYAIHFFTLLQAMGEAFVDAMVARGRTTPKLDEWLVCLSNLQRYQRMLQEFGERDVMQQLIPLLGDPERVIEHQRRVIAEQTRASTMETGEEFERHIIHTLERSVLSFLSDLIGAEMLGKFPVPPSVMKQAADCLESYLGQQLSTAKNNLDEGLFTKFINEIAARAYYGAFHSLLLREGKRQLSESQVALLLNLLQTLYEVMESVGGDRLQGESLDLWQRNGRILTALLGQSSKVLAHMVKMGELDRVERVQVELLLRSRRDSGAKQYLVISCDK
ncbi:hypothetical protein TraAM80_02434 [Trypanosoma rangeli]|uniref:MHD2 domain-containing protein n=1 Tax=Trypanosoma rangeli TaxID=5698 RepID=A0A3R7NX30_TRYRA|nr:uncharacterized protein TraAM80_02434 [Trypanosoma rangeli]RNF09037.1 hypothetical protein TraAM80_02434 [Trypanosoma rangeli]|eukprot:RNF09037.1 hypothetical protein TraAM80_02434 [Trypanosoma rangeli]